MKAPDKIYLTPRINDETSLCALWFNKKQVGENYEYIRKDALLEWAENKKDEIGIGLCEYDAGEENGKYEIITDLINKINSL